MSVALENRRLTETEARSLTEEVKADAAALWAKLLGLYEGEAHTALGYSSWGAYYEAEFGQSGNYGYRLLEAARVVAQLPNGNSAPPSESVAREMVPVLREAPEQVEEVWADVVEQYGDTPTAAEVRGIVQTRKPDALAKKLRSIPQGDSRYEEVIWVSERLAALPDPEQLFIPDGEAVDAAMEAAVRFFEQWTPRLSAIWVARKDAK